MLKVIQGNPALPPKPLAPDAPCPHGFAAKGNCTRCTPPPKYSPMNGQRNR